MASYQPNIPTGTVNLDVDYQNIQGNFQTLNDVYSIDHVSYTNATSTKGYHKPIHLVSVGAPAAVSGTGQLYSTKFNDGYANSDVFFYKSGSNNTVTQLSRNFQPSATTNGYTSLPGGLVLQWGTFNISGLQTLDLNFVSDLGLKNFISNNFGVFGKSVVNGSAVININFSLFSLTGFRAINSSSTNAVVNFITIGN